MKKAVGLLAVIYSLLITGCISTAPFDQEAYQTAVDLKVDSLRLMDQASESYTNHTAEADSLMLRVHKAYEYAKGKPGNDETVAQWAKMMDPKDKLMAGFIADWEAKGQIKKSMIDNKKPMMAEAYDTIIDLESAKLKK
jgi:hypothetical protein